MKKLIIAALVLVGLTCQAQKANEKETVVVIKTTMPSGYKVKNIKVEYKDGSETKEITRAW